MKRFVAFLTVLMLLAGMTAGMAEGDYLTIQELREQTVERWTQTYTTKWRNVAIDAAIVVPNVEQVPVMLIAGGIKTPVLTAEEAGWDKVEARGSYSLILSNQETEYPKSVDGKRINQDQEARGTWSGNIDPNEAYVPMSEITFGEICDLADEALMKLGYDPQEYTYRTPYHMWAQHMFYYGYKKDALPGSLFFQCYQKLNGIPLLSHIQRAVVDHKNGESRADEYSEFPETHLGYSGYGEQLSHILLWRGEPVEVLAQDVPLCPFDKVMAVIEPKIEDGHIRKVFEIELGYVMFNQPGVYHQQKEPMVEGRNTREELENHKLSRLDERSAARYYVKPMWRVNCLWVDNANGSLRDISSYTDDERNTLDYCQLLIDAQTGDLVVESQAQDRCEFKGFISWDEVK